MSNNSIITPGLFATAYGPNLFDPDHDPYWNKVATLMHFDGAQGNSSFVDVKGRPITNYGVITDLGNPAIAPSTAYFGGAAQAMIISQVDDNQTGDFTIEWFGKWETIGNCTLFDTRPQSTNGPYMDFFYSSGGVGIWFNNATAVYAAFVPAQNRTYHLALSRKGGIIRFFIDGAIYFTWNYAGVVAIPRFFLGGNGYNQAQDWYKGRMSEFRYTKGVGRYENSFIPVYARFPASL